ncbi:MAG: NAD(P)-binding domain-containing protein, partial [Actinomycetota bacterium]
MAGPGPPRAGAGGAHRGRLRRRLRSRVAPSPPRSRPAGGIKSPNQEESAMVTLSPRPKIGWIGTGRMGYAMVQRLLKAGHDVSVWNRTRSKAEPLTEEGAT